MSQLESPFTEVSTMGQRSASTQKLHDSLTKTHGLANRIKQASTKNALSRPRMARSKFSVSKSNYLSKAKESPTVHAQELEQQLNNQLKTHNSLKAYQETLAAIAAKDLTFGPLVARIQQFYDAQLHELQAPKLFETNERLKSEVTALNEQIETELRHQKQLERKIEKFTRENEDLAGDIEDRENKYLDMQDQMLKISTLDLGNLSLNDESWQFLVTQNKQFSEACKELRSKNKAYRQNEKRLLKLVLALKKRGVPVEEVYETDVKQKKMKLAYSGNLNDEPAPDDTEAENIVEGSPKMASRPGCVPSLQLEENYYESSESSSYPDDSGGYSYSQMSAPGYKTN